MRIREILIQYRPHPSGATADARVLTRPPVVAAIVRQLIAEQDQEVFIALFLNTKGRLLCVREIARGSQDNMTIDPRVIFRAALVIPEGPAAALIVAHNHPSGDPTPSLDDLDVTRKLKQAGQMIGIELWDHVIIGHEEYVSLKETGRMECL